jgi:uncharacterized protein
MKLIIGLLFFFTFLIPAFAQDSIPGMVYQKYNYPNGIVSSEGYLRDGKPDAYWKTYYENGRLKAEGNRVDYMLEGIWKFYNEKGELTLSIEYSRSLKNGKRTTYQGAEILEENFVNDVKQDWTYVYFPDRQLKQKTFFADGRESGLSFEYDRDANVIALTEWRNGFVINREQINRRDGLGRKQGTWKEFYADGSVKKEMTFRNDVLDGYMKEYDGEGNLLEVSKYQDGELVKDAVEVAEYEIRTDYYPNGSVKIIGTYKSGQPHGVRKEYDQQGRMTVAYVFNEGQISGMGLMDEQGRRQGLWKEYYSTGQLMAEGTYSSNRRTGKWVYYYRNGKVEQQGTYDSKGRPGGVWEWFHPNGVLQMREEYADGMLNGLMEEWNDKGDLIGRGRYVEDLEEGLWFTEVNDHREEGEYVAGAREGEWKSSFPGGLVYYSGKFVADLPNGKHVWLWENGNKKTEGLFVMGVREGDWRFYDLEGVLVLTVSYRNGIEIKYEGVKIEPEIETEGTE